MANTQVVAPEYHDIKGLIIDFGSTPAYRPGARLSRFAEGVTCTNCKRLSPESVFGMFVENSRSGRLRLGFLKEAGIIDHYLESPEATDAAAAGAGVARFSSQVDIQSDVTRPERISISLYDRDPEFAASQLSRFVEYMDRQTVNNLHAELGEAVKDEIAILDNRLSKGIRAEADRIRRQIERLQEALVIARELGIHEFDGPAVVVADGRSSAVPEGMFLYLLGTRALQAHINLLQSRKPEAQLTPDMHELRAIRDRLAEIVTVSEGLASAIPDAAVNVPVQAERPRKKVVLVLALIAGLMLGITLAFIAAAMSRESRKPA